MDKQSKFVHCKEKFKNNFSMISGKDENLAFNIRGTEVKQQKIVYKAIGKHFCDADLRKVKDGYRRSIMDMDALYEDIRKMDLPPWDIIEDEHFELALKVVEERMFNGKVFKPIHFCEVRNYPWKYNKSACQPYLDNKPLRQEVKDAYLDGKFRNPNMSFANLRNVIFRDARMKIHEIKDSPEPVDADDDIHLYDINAFARSHLVEREDPDKIRFVYGCPKIGILAECMFTWPFHAHVKTQGDSGIMAWGYETLNGGLFRLAADSTGRESDWNGFLCLDWKQFDKRFHFRLMERIFAIWTEHIDFRGGYEPSWEYPNTTPSDPDLQEKRLRRLFSWMTHTIMNAPIRGPDGDRYRRHFAGMPSGIFNTNYLDCWGNAIILLTCLSALGFDITDRQKVDIKVMGDDSYIKVGAHRDLLIAMDFLNRFGNEAFKRFNYILNLQKSVIVSSPEDAVFLGYRSRNGYPMRDTFQILSLFAHPERSIHTSILAARAVGFAWASCMYDPRVYAVCKDVYDYLTKVLKVVPKYANMRFLEYTGLDADAIDFSRFPTPEEIKSRLIPTDPIKVEPLCGLPTDVFIQDPSRVPPVIDYFIKKAEELKIPLEQLTSLGTYQMPDSSWDPPPKRQRFTAAPHQI